MALIKSNGALIKTKDNFLKIQEKEPNLGSFSLNNNFKILFSKNEQNYEYNPSYEEDTNVDGYVKSICVEKDRENYYIPLTSKDTGNQMYDGLYISNGRYSTRNQNNGMYQLDRVDYLRNAEDGWNFGFKMDNRGNRVPTELLEDALNRVNSAFPSANIQVVSTVQKNYIILGEFSDSWVGLCTNELDRIKIELNKPNLISAYGEYTNDKTSSSYKAWLSTTVHELGHSFGCKDQASHTPSLYSYSRNREKATYLQANDIAWLKYAYAAEGADDSIFITPNEAQTAKVRAETIEPSLNFDYPIFNSEDNLKENSTNIVTAALSFKSNEDLNIGNDKIINYNIYNIEVITNEKGTLTNTLLKIPAAMNIDISNETIYRLYLKDYVEIPCSLVNVQNGLVKILQ